MPAAKSTPVQWPQDENGVYIVTDENVEEFYQWWGGNLLLREKEETGCQHDWRMTGGWNAYTDYECRKCKETRRELADGWQ